MEVEINLRHEFEDLEYVLIGDHVVYIDDIWGDSIYLDKSSVDKLFGYESSLKEYDEWTIEGFFEGLEHPKSPYVIKSFEIIDIKEGIPVINYDLLDQRYDKFKENLREYSQESYEDAREREEMHSQWKSGGF